MIISKYYIPEDYNIVIRYYKMALAINLNFIKAKEMTNKLSKE